ncbi:hypothetical protein C8R44DRAFT_858346 [Mycena epipterygia]|nr:hypothetical protein C8R44DRAFT_858346 [Mycena epipterygia]
MSTRSSARTISSNIAKLAAQDLIDSEDEDMDATLVGLTNEDEDEDEEEEEGEEEEETEERDGTGEDSDEEDEVVEVPKKRKRSRAEKKSTDQPPAREIEYKISIYTAEQLKKSKASRGPPTTKIVTLNSGESWDTLKVQILAKIKAVLAPSLLSIGSYNITFTIPRQVIDPIQLDYENYSHLLKNALKIKTNPSVKIIVEPKAGRSKPEKENNGLSDESDGGDGKKGSKKTKTKIRKERDILPANAALNSKIGALRAKWMCPTPGGPCGSEYCFVSPTDPEHFPLSHAHMESWGSAMLKGEQFASIDKPPNNNLFDKVSPTSLAAQSPLLQRRLELKEKAAANSTPAAPQVHFNFPPDFANFLRPTAPAAAVPPALIAPATTSDMLIPPPLIAGPDLSIEDFCLLYNLDEDISTRFLAQKFKRTNTFKYIEVAELKEMGFMKGEVAELKVAISEWAQMPMIA